MFGSIFESSVQFNWLDPEAQEQQFNIKEALAEIHHFYLFIKPNPKTPILSSKHKIFHYKTWYPEYDYLIKVLHKPEVTLEFIRIDFPSHYALCFAC